MVRDGYYYALPLVGAALLLGWLAGALWALPVVLLAAFFLWFFRDPERAIPGGSGALRQDLDKMRRERVKDAFGWLWCSID